MAKEAKSGSESTLIAAQGQETSSELVGTAVISPDAVENPGLPTHGSRVTDLDEKKERSAERVVFTLFYLSLAGSLAAVLAYMFFPIESGNLLDVRLHTMFVGAGMTLGLFALGLGAIHWGKALMAAHESIEERTPTPSTPEVREEVAEIFEIADKESGFSRRSLVRNSLIGALVAFPLPGLVLLRGLGPQDVDPVEVFRHTMWEPGIRLARDPSGVAIKASDVQIGSVFHVIPENLDEAEHHLNEKAKAIVLLMRLDPRELIEEEDRKSWSYDGIVAYSKVCTHVGCPVALYEQHTHHLLCPCHQSQFDVSEGAKVIFGPAKRPLPQLPITVDDEGYLIAQSDFTEPVGPSYWERLK